MNESPISIDIELLKPHPANPRIVEREDVIAAIEQQLRTGCFDPSHAILVRRYPGGYQIISGHNRIAAAQRAGLKQIPAWIRDMDDSAAFMELVLANAQGELSPLERGLHALAAIQAGQTVRSYADAVARSKSTVQLEASAARVALSTDVDKVRLADSTRHLAEIHVAPERCWPGLVDRLVENNWTVEQTKSFVQVVNTAKPPRGHEEIFRLADIQQRIAAGEDVNAMINQATRAIERARGDLRDGQFDSDSYRVRFDNWLVDRGPWDLEALSAEAARLLRLQRDGRKEAESKATKLKRPVTLSEWKTLTAPECQSYLAVRNEKAKLLKQDKDSAIDWARFSWNPVTGCQHNCPYCYARDIAERFYTQKFEPSIIPDALAAPLNSTPPKEAAVDVGYKNVFTCSMADLFGKWVPREWIEAVLAVMREAKQWNFLLLTKFPQRYAEFEFPENVWLGTTVDCQARVANAERAMAKANATVKWLSIEPLLEPITMDFSLFQWAVIGGASKSTQTPEWKPPRTWVMDVTCRAKSSGCAVYWKANLNLDPLREFPGSILQSELASPPEQFRLRVIRDAD